jgi:YgiT-type zinc finger domain-containing protein
LNPCICGKSGVFKIGTVTHTPNGIDIKIHNIPHYNCESCGSTWYDITKVKPSKYIKYAIENGLNEIDFNLNI